jgi:lipoprotein-releasing system ATP-binding protein
MILSAKNINKSYKTGKEILTVLNNLSLEIQSPEFISIMGPSGAGKSTLLHILGTLDDFDSGELLINSEKIINKKDYSEFRSKNIGFIFQFHHLLHEFTIIENLIIPQILVNKNKITIQKNAEDLLEQLNLFHLKNRYPGQISGGERQRIAVLRALVNQPKLLFADEPTGNLDQENSNKLLELFNTIKDKFETTIVVATHDEIVKNYTNRNLYLDNGILTEN